jgi:hypothetical protein
MDGGLGVFYAGVAYKIRHAGVAEGVLLDTADSTGCCGAAATGSDVPGHLV